MIFFGEVLINSRSCEPGNYLLTLKVILLVLPYFRCCGGGLPVSHLSSIGISGLAFSLNVFQPEAPSLIVQEFIFINSDLSNTEFAGRITSSQTASHDLLVNSTCIGRRSRVIVLPVVKTFSSIASYNRSFLVYIWTYGSVISFGINAFFECLVVSCKVGPIFLG